MNSIWNIYLFVALYFYRLSVWIMSIVLRKKSADDGILFLENFPIENAGYQYRAYKWKEIFEQRGLRCEVCTLIEDRFEFDKLTETPSRFMIFAMRKRLCHCLYARRFKIVVVRRELLLYNDYGNLFMDRFLLKIHPNVILDFDDDISAAKREPRKIMSTYGRLMHENGNKFNETLKLYHRFVVGSEYLKRRVLTENKSINENDVLVVPTCVDYDKFPAKVYSESETIVLGWIGGNHNLHYLDMLVEPLNRLADDFNFKLVVVAGSDYSNTGAKYPIENRKWSLADEKDIIRSFDIGLMPIEDNAVGRGKCGFKLLQYMGLGVIGVATDVSVNGEIIEDGKNGLLVSADNSNWYEVLKKALSLQGKYTDIGKSARNTVEERYAFSANVERYADFVK